MRSCREFALTSPGPERMFDELEHLREDARLATLLTHYAEKGEADREAWQDRLMALEGVPADTLVKLHGALLAFDWLEQNTGITPVLRPAAVPQCYRITGAGRRALRRARLEADADEAEAA
jgi:hypothetical protein